MRKRIVQSRNLLMLILILAFTTFLITLVSLLIIYNTTTRTVKSALSDIVEGEKAMVAAMAAHGLDEDTIVKLMKKSHDRRQSIGKTGELVIAKLMDKDIKFLFFDSNSIPPSYEQVMKQNYATPMKMALSGKSGFVKGKDYRGIETFACYAFVKEFNWGIVAKINTAEVNEPFRKAANAAIALALFCIICGSLLFIRVTNPLLHGILKSEDKFRSLFNASASTITISDFNGRLLEVNDIACRKLQYGRDELFNLSIRDITSPAFDDKGDEIIRRLSESEVLSYESEYITKNGQIIAVQVNSKIIEYDNAKAILSLAMDISERKRVERERAKLLDVIEKSMNEIYIFDALTLT